MTLKSQQKAQIIGYLDYSGVPVEIIARELGIARETLKDYLAALKGGYSNISAFKEHYIIKKGFGGPGDYYEHLARKNGFKSLRERLDHRARAKGCNSHLDYQAKALFEIAINSGFDSVGAYHRHLAKKRQKRHDYILFGETIRERLCEMQKSRAWLARQVGVTRQSVSLYAQSKIMPDQPRLKKIFRVLEIPQSRLEDILKSG